MVDPALMRGDGWVRCCLCGELHLKPFPNLYRDEHGSMWDQCATCHEDPPTHEGAA